MTKNRKRLGDILLEGKLITPEQLNKALEIQKKTGERLGEILIKQGYISEEEMVEILEFQLGIPKINLHKYLIEPEIVKILPEAIARKYTVFPVKVENNTLTLAVNDPFNIIAIDDIKMLTGLNVEIVLATKSEIEKAIDNYYSSKEVIQKVLQEIKIEIGATEDESIGIVDISEEETAPVIRLINTVINQAVKENASDIHIEPQERNIRVRFRIDGELYEVIRWPKNLLPSVLTRIKILAGMDITQRRLPQDGHLELQIENNNIDVRVSTLPTVHGEKIVLRIFNRKHSLLGLEELGFNGEQIEIIERILKIPYGMILVTGPTGSGKTTTLYSMLNKINNPTKNIITLEDPVEYILNGINQVQINMKTGFSFASGLRSILRQDPDIIMVGEIRDAETADIAVRAALTGHLVFSTLHTNNAIGTITRLLDMGLEPYLVASCLVGIIAQRLVRKNCPYCKEKYEPLPHEKAFFDDDKELVLYKSKGCNFCSNTGFKGRTVLAEILPISAELRELIAKKATNREIAEKSQKIGFKSMKDVGLEMVKNGITTLDEILKVLYSEED
ncbi:GspE/PulE family protein [Thermovenabulum gondwanense]|uniref:Type II secretion system protein E n=1 Tax=Thermovenabulum gondwanense TaxID=520767 RepID=A0A162MH42_9FIRM|nr:ATPase, T2SS/T4P/T4SS family [Thermovenabulum gondwanense]KYO65842.1 Type II secretion system protein E [Thermovenabulum gondwanense]